MTAKRFLALLLCAAALLCLGCQKQPQQPQPPEPPPLAEPEAEPETQAEPSSEEPLELPNPIAPVEDHMAFEALGFGVKAPEGAQEVSYSIVARTTAQVSFILDGTKYLYRAGDGMQWQMLSGIYERFDGQAAPAELGQHGEAALLTVSKTGARLAYWSTGTVTRTLYTAQAVSDEELVLLIKELTG